MSQEPSAELDSHLERMKRDGYTIVERVIDADTVAALRDDVRRLERELATRPAANLFEGVRTLRIYNLLVHGAIYHPISIHERVLPIIEGVLDRGCLVSSLSSIDIGPGEVDQPLHADDQLIPLPKPHVSIICNTMWALTDFTAANGATRLVPGTHQADRSPQPFGERVKPIAAEMAAGSVLVFDGSIWHGGGGNQTDEPRLGIAMNYCAGWLRQQENQQLGIPAEIAREFPPRLRKLVGYGLYKGLIGHIDKATPDYLLDGGPPTPVVGFTK
ncbi:MAG TPA: phytanoyl-CoA dioxygenase family protein [Kofleriaceae bacterium]|jgi:ectoine hydroxylase-related dioxygenase (phytanoyl-CoA dioxygenase family)|nr:phytanoyl-CoA dioxygenase family protein [Kofleriaceae bacterium]